MKIRERTHIDIKYLEDCSGCAACKSVCPARCISMVADFKGFKYARVDDNLCIECGKCRSVCPFVSIHEKRDPIECRAAVNSDPDIRLKSTSGGIFIQLAKEVIAHGGIVYGAVFDEDLNVHHIGVSSIKEAEGMKGSKYVQSDTEDLFPEVKKNLDDGKEVLFTGTQCQIAGLHHFLDRDYENLYLVEVVCHGVPSPLIWSDYVKELFQIKENKASQSKRLEEEASELFLSFNINDNRKGRKNPYLSAYWKGYSLRPSCFACRCKSGTSDADISLGFYSGIDKFLDVTADKSGISAVILWTEQGKSLFERCKGIASEEVTLKEVLKNNMSLVQSIAPPKNIEKFWKIYHKKGLKKASYRCGVVNLKNILGL